MSSILDKAKDGLKKAVTEVKEHVVDPTLNLAVRVGDEIHEHVVDPLIHKHKPEDKITDTTNPEQK